jgi:proteasome assembly chaperone (PAC2) family protein
MSWRFEQVGKVPKLNKPILIEGLPGIGNVGKVAVDFIIEKLGATQIYDIRSSSMPHSVFVNEDNLIDLPKIELYYKKMKGRDLLLLTGDVQPIDEVSCHEFCEQLLDEAMKLKVSEIVTIGGIGLQDEPKKPKVFCTGNDKAIVEKYCKGTGLTNKIYGVVGPIIGVSGLLLGLSKRRKVPAVSMLAETFSHPFYLGIKGAREVLKALNIKLGIKMNLKELDKEIKGLEGDLMQKTKELSQITKETALKRIEGKFGKDVTYIG